MTEQAVVQWVTDYGYFGIFFLLIFGIIGLPVPDEWLLVISGYLAFKNVLGFVPTVAVAVLGSAGGLTMSYVLGRTSSGYMVRRYGHWLSIDDEKIRSTEHWFQNLGRWVLVRMGTHVEDFDTWRIPVLPNQWVRCHYENRHLFVGIARHRRRFCTSYLPNSHSWIAARE